MLVFLLQQQVNQLPDSVAQASDKDASPSAGLDNQPFPEKYVLSWERARFREIPQYINDCVWRVPDFLSKVGLLLGESRDLDLCDLDPESDAELDEEMGEAKDLRQARNRLKLGKTWFNDAVHSMLNAGFFSGGFINFAQEVEYPTCPHCDVRMTVNFLILTEDEALPFLWGDGGTGHVTLCPKCGKPGLCWA